MTKLMTKEQKQKVFYELATDIKGVVSEWDDQYRYTSSAGYYLESAINVLYNKYEFLSSYENIGGKDDIWVALQTVFDKSMEIHQPISNLNGEPLPDGSYTVLKPKSMSELLDDYTHFAELPTDKVIEIVRHFLIVCDENGVER